ncbi:hypothetical protein BBP40_003639 [Aspergillus hancockii]|nr:hypothetical protein BBP40_003639 [Aspergillus hancockii]
MDCADALGRTPLLSAASNGHEAVVKLLADKGSYMHSYSQDTAHGQTALSLAAENGRKEVVVLLEKGAGQQDNHNTFRAPLSWAAKSDHKDIVKLLAECGMDLNSRDTTFGQTPLSLAAENAHRVHCLLDIDANTDDNDN